MFFRLVQKELLHHLLDFRFVGVFALCALLSALSVFVGSRNYVRLLQDHRTTKETSRQAFEEASRNTDAVHSLIRNGYLWNRRPEVLSPVVFGLSGTLGRETFISYQSEPIFDSSLFATDPVHALFETLDLAFIVKVILSLCVLLFTYDAVCGEKEGGTLRLYMSFPVSRSSLALAKLTGSTVAVLVPFVFAFLLIAAVMALFPEVGLQGEDWARMGALLVVFALYLMVFAAFGLWVSALTHRRMTAFLCLLALWALWIFVAPNLAVDVARYSIPLHPNFYELQKQRVQLRKEIGAELRAEMRDYFRSTFTQDPSTLSDAQKAKVQQEMKEAQSRISKKWNADYHRRLQALHREQRNRMHRRQHLVRLLSAISPFGAVSSVSMDIARTGFVQQERMEQALKAHKVSMIDWIGRTASAQEAPPADEDSGQHPWFTFRDRETLGECLSRNRSGILNLFLLTALGFAGAYVAILRYDVR